MKKLVLAMAAVAAITSPVAFGQANTQTSADLVITGEITDAACGMSIDNIDFKAVSTRRFDSTTGASQWVTSNIVFDDCSLESSTPAESASSINISFSNGSPAGGKENLWANNGDAGNVGIELQVDGKNVPPRNAAAIKIELDENNLANIKRVDVPVRARLAKIVDGQKVTPGKVSGTVTVFADFK